MKVFACVVFAVVLAFVYGFVYFNTGINGVLLLFGVSVLVGAAIWAAEVMDW